MVAKAKQKTTKKKSALKPVKETTQEINMQATIIDAEGKVTELTKPFGEKIVVIEQMANVGLSVGETINTGNYSSMKYQVSLHVPCYAEEMNAVYKGIKKKLAVWAKELKTDIEAQI